MDEVVGLKVEPRVGQPPDKAVFFVGQMVEWGRAQILKTRFGARLQDTVGFDSGHFQLIGIGPQWPWPQGIPLDPTPVYQVAFGD